MEKILISACLLGNKVRYDGNAMSLSAKILDEWVSSGRVISVCPEVDAGMSVPRAPAEILGGDGHDVLSGVGVVVDNTGMDVTAYFSKGARAALALCDKHNISVAVLTENSPSCGSSAIYDGRFSNQKINGVGVTTALLRSNGIDVFSQHNIENANKALLRKAFYYE